MAAPTPTARGTPTGIVLEDGYRSLVTFANDTTINLREKHVTPQALEGGDPIDQTTMWNTTYKTKAPQALIDTVGGQMTCAYDPKCYDNIRAIINRKTTITQTFPDGSTLAYYGFLQSFTPAALVPGTQPEATVVIVSTNWDHVNKVEAAPVMTEVAGT